ncbi:iron-sulfur cluster assembly scaffold protein [[Eubacterium] cellulosolvens]
MYNEKVLEHYRNPKNVGEIKNADGIGIYMSGSCGDITKFWIKVDQGKITDAKYKTQGCAASIACGSALTEMIKNKTVDETIKLTKNDLLIALGGLPEQKIHCSMLADDALKDAIRDYLTKNNMPVPRELVKKYEELMPQIKELEKKGYLLI